MRALVFTTIVALILLAASPIGAGEAVAPITLQDVSGGDVTLADALSGGPKLVVFWTTWCGYCRAEIPRLKQAHQRYGGRGLEVVAIDPGIRDTFEKAKAYTERHALPYRVLFDPENATVERFGLSGTPTLLLLDGEGREVHRGHEVDFGAIDALLGGGS